jgi:hypothetical protein
VGGALALALLLAPVPGARADLGDDLIEDGVALPNLMDVSRFDGDMPDDAETLFGVDLSQKSALDVAPELENGTDIGYVDDDRKASGRGKAGVIVGDVDEGEVDVRGGFLKANSKGVVIFGWQMGEPTKVSRSSDKVAVSQNRDIAVLVTVTGEAGGMAVAELSTVQVPLCKVKATFRNESGTYDDENLPDSGSWKVTCKSGWIDSLPDITPTGARVLRKVMGGKKFTMKGRGPGVDLDEVLEDLDLPFL